MKYTTGATSTIYPSKYYNISGTTPTKHIYAGDQLIATIKGTGTAAKVYPVSTDHLTGSNVVTNNSGAVEELMDYYPYGDIRLDEKAGTFSEQRKFAGHEYDANTGLSYMNARYYNGKIGRFVSQDPAYLAVGNAAQLKSVIGMDTIQYLSDPQALNSYAYARNNPLRYTDPTGEFFGQFGIDMSNSQRSIAQSFYNLAGYLNNQGIVGQMLGARELGIASNIAGGVADNVANIVDPRQGAGSRLFAVGMAALDVGSGGEGSAAKKLTSNELGKIGERLLEKIVGSGKVHSYHMVEGVGKRFIDRETETALHEAKYGYITATTKILEQSYKDSIIQAETGKEAVWHLFKGGSENAINALKDKGIKVIDYTK